MKTLIVGLGNPILGDDGVGWHIAKLVGQKIQAESLDLEQVDIDSLSLGGLSLMEHLVGYDRAILIDAIHIERGPLGSVYRFMLEELPDPGAGHTSSVHDTTLQTALKMGRTLGMKLPDQITVIAIEAHIDYTFTESLSPPVAAAVPVAAEMVLEALGNPRQT